MTRNLMKTDIENLNKLYEINRIYNSPKVVRNFPSKEKKQIIKKYGYRNKKNIINSDSSLFNTNTNYKSPYNKKDKKCISNEVLL